MKKTSQPDPTDSDASESVVDTSTDEQEVHRRHGLRISLANILALITLAATYFAYLRAENNLAASEERLVRANFRSGQLPQGDLKNFEYVAEVAGRKWLVWVPFNQQLRLRVQTHSLSSPATRPIETEDIVLPQGNHRISLEPGPESSWRILVNGKEKFHRSESDNWNISRLNYFPITYTSVETIRAPILLQDAYGTAKLAAGEDYDPKIHRFGIRIWLDAAE